MASSSTPKHFRALVDMGSNGIRFSISDMSPATARTLPTIYQDRCGISLYDDQYSNGTKIPIPDTVIRDVLSALLRFKNTCQDFGVPDGNAQIVATEATRNALNSQVFQDRIKEKLGWQPELLSKEEEGRLGVMGVASSVSNIEGLVLDMGGGSVQITWVIKQPDGNVETGPFISLPFGAAALMGHLENTNTQEQYGALHEDINSQLQAALKDLRIPDKLQEAARVKRGYNLYLSGGGFRGWGFLLMSLDQVQPYPIPIINGYRVQGKDFMPCLDQVQIDPTIHRISNRRASQVPAVQLLIKSLLQVLEPLSAAEVIFAQGGVREGLLYSDLPNNIRAQSPLESATLQYAPPSAAALTSLLRDATPECARMDPCLLVATVDLLHAHAPISKDIRAAAALRCTTTGLLAGVHGLLHLDRAMLALILCERWGGESVLPPTETEFYDTLQAINGKEMSWWAKYVGVMAKGIAKIYPAGVLNDGREAFTVSCRLGIDQVFVKIRVNEEEIEDVVQEWAKELRKLGKKKSRVGGKDSGWGIEVEVIVTNILGK